MNSGDVGGRVSATVAVLVTYGDRRELLQGALDALEHEHEICHIVVVDNGCPRPITKERLKSGHPLSIYRVDFNSGSAGGFRIGIEEAGKLEGAEYIILLDDDNYGSAGFVRNLINLHDCLGGSEKVVLSALRRNRSDYLRYLKYDRPQVRPSSFLGFTVTRVLAKIWEITSRLLAAEREVGQARVRAVRVAPYGGLFMCASVPGNYGLPDERLVLYGDDHEYVLRLSESGVVTFLTDTVFIDDLETSWNERQGVGNTWISKASPAWRVYFALRNRVLVEKYFVTSSVLYRLNIALYISYLYVACLLDRRSLGGVRSGMRPVMAGLRDGLNGILVTPPEYRLPGGAPSAA